MKRRERTVVKRKRKSAIDAYRARGFVHKSGSQDEARAALIGRWRAIESKDVECEIKAYTNRERIAVNARASQWRVIGRLVSRVSRTITLLDTTATLWRMHCS